MHFEPQLQFNFSAAHPQKPTAALINIIKDNIMKKIMYFFLVVTCFLHNDLAKLYVKTYANKVL